METTKTLHQSTMDRVYENWKKKHPEWKFPDFIDHLDPKERFAVCTGNLNYQVCNGGFIQWWDNRYGTPETVDYLIHVLDQVKGTATSKVVRLLVKFRNLELSEDLWEDDYDSKEAQKNLDNLDTTYYQINEQFLVECEEYLKTFQNPCSGSVSGHCDCEVCE